MWRSKWQWAGETWFKGNSRNKYKCCTVHSFVGGFLSLMWNLLADMLSLEKNRHFLSALLFHVMWNLSSFSVPLLIFLPTLVHLIYELQFRHSLCLPSLKDEWRGKSEESNQRLVGHQKGEGFILYSNSKKSVKVWKDQEENETQIFFDPLMH